MGEYRKGIAQPSSSWRSKCLKGTREMQLWVNAREEHWKKKPYSIKRGHSLVKKSTYRPLEGLDHYTPSSSRHSQHLPCLNMIYQCTLLLSTSVVGKVTNVYCKYIHFPTFTNFPYTPILLSFPILIISPFHYVKDSSFNCLQVTLPRSGWTQNNLGNYGNADWWKFTHWSTPATVKRLQVWILDPVTIPTDLWGPLAHLLVIIPHLMDIMTSTSLNFCSGLLTNIQT